MNIMFALSMTSPSELISGVAHRAKRRRIDAGLTQRELAERAGVSYGSLRLFEETGKIAFGSLVKVAFALGVEEEVEGLFPPHAPTTIDDVAERPARQRVRRK